MSKAISFRFDRMEWAGSLGDLGTLLPLSVGLIVINGMQATNVFIVIGLFYLLAGLYFRTPIAVQPQKVVGAYAIASGLSPQQITAVGLWIGVLVLFLGATGLVNWIGRLIPKSVIRGIQLSIGVMLATKGLRLIIDADPNLTFWSLGPIHTGVVLGIVGFVLAFLFLDSKRFPAALVLIAFGVAAGAILGKNPEGRVIAFDLHLPSFLPYDWPEWSVWLAVLPVVVLPQLPITVGNAIISNVDLSHELFPESRSRITLRSVALSQAFANIASFFLGGIPVCHGAGGLAAHYRFGARTGGSNLIIGGILLLLAPALGDNLLPLLQMVPLAVLGVLLSFAGLQLALMIQDMEGRKDFFVILGMLVTSLAVNLAIGFGVGIALAYLLRCNHDRQLHSM